MIKCYKCISYMTLKLITKKNSNNVIIGINKLKI